MTPRAITADDLELFAGLEPRPALYAADDPTFETCPAIITKDAAGSDVGGGMVVRVAWQLDEIELAALAQGGTLWLSTWGGLPPHAMFVQPRA